MQFPLCLVSNQCLAKGAERNSLLIVLLCLFIRVLIFLSVLATYINPQGHLMPYIKFIESHETRHTIAQLRFLVLQTTDKKQGGLNNQLLRRELFWIFKLKSLEPRGLNDRCKYMCYL